MNFFSERRLPVIQTTGMLFLAILTTLGVGSYVIWSFTEHFEDELAQTEAQAIAVQEALLDNQLTAVVSRLDYERSRTEALLRDKLREHTNTAISIAQTLYDRNQGQLSDKAIQSLIIETLRPLRFFNGRGYYIIGTIETQNTRVLLAPPTPELEGKSLWNFRGAMGNYPGRDIMNSVKNDAGEGYTRHLWYPPGETQRRVKITHARRFEPYNWVIGNGEYPYRIIEDLKQAALAEITNIRFGASSYMAIIGSDGSILASPNNTDLVGIPLSNLSKARRAILQSIQSQAKSGGGTLRYSWERLGEREITRKLARVVYYKPWGWTLVTGIYLDDIDTLLSQRRENMTDHVSDQISNLTWVMFVVLLVSLAFALGFGRWVRRILDVYRSDLEARNRDLAESRNRLKLHAEVFNSSGEAMIITDANSRIVAVNTAFSRITGYTEAEALNRDPRLLKSGRHDAFFFQTMWKSIIDQNGWSGEIWNRHKNGRIFPAWLSISSVRDEQGMIANFIGILTDITRRKENEEKIRELAFYDPLTRLPNRRLLRDRLEQAIGMANRSKHQGAVLFMDLDNFKTLNDTRGHDVGDLLLVEVAERLKGCLREQDTVARLGGDEFIVVLVDLSTNEQEAVRQIERAIVKIMAVISKPYCLAGIRYYASVSIGACLFHWAQNEIDTLLRHADTAMYHAKQQGRNRLRFFDPTMQKILMERTRLEEQLRNALEREEFVCFYQPQVDREGQIIGAEVLIRWRHPSMGMISPQVFIPLAEETGLIVPIGTWVLHQACARLKLWRQRPNAAHLTLAVNVSSVQFCEADFIPMVEQAINTYDIAPHSLKLELTESLVLKDVEGSIEIMNHLKLLGVGFSMDDFGTGYSSLAYLKRLPLSQLKIDQSFVRDIIDDHNDVVIVRTIIAMAHSMGLDVLAEGVETVEQLECLIANGCCYFQGYHFGRPMDVDSFEDKAGLTF